MSNERQAAVGAVPVTKREIFRAEALKQYLQGREKTVLPRYSAASVFTLMWAMLGVLFVAAWIIWMSRIPVYSLSACAVINAQGQAVIFLHPQDLPKLKIGQRVQILLDEQNQQLIRSVGIIEPQLIGPTEARERYSLDGASLTMLKRPSAVVIVELGKEFNHRMYAGSVLRARVEIGSVRVASMLPILGQLIGEEQWN